MIDLLIMDDGEIKRKKKPVTSGWWFSLSLSLAGYPLHQMMKKWCLTVNQCKIPSCLHIVCMNEWMEHTGTVLMHHHLGWPKSQCLFIEMKWNDFTFFSFFLFLLINASQKKNREWKLLFTLLKYFAKTSNFIIIIIHNVALHCSTFKYMQMNR